VTTDLRLVPFDPRRWAEIRRSDRLAFVARVGLPVGLVLALSIDSALLWLSGDGDLLLSVWRLPRLVLSLVTIGPVLGVSFAHGVWSWCEGRYRTHLLKEAFRAAPGDALPGETEAGAPDR
jgi:hypothetical protein